MLADQTPKALAEHLSGIWKIVVVCDEKNDISNLSGIHIALSIPDKGGKVFSVLSQRMRGLPETRVDLEKQFIKLERVPGQMCIPFICKGKDSLILCSSPLAGERTKVTHPAGKLSGAAETYRQYLSPEGVGLVFCKNPFQFNAFYGKIDTITVSPALAVVKKLPDGLEIEEISPWDLNTRFILSSLSLAFKLVSDKVNSPPRPRKKAQPGTRTESSAAPAAAPEAAAPEAPAAVPKAPAQNLCRSGIGKVGKKLLEYTARKKVWPPHGIAGLRELIRQKQLTAAEMTCPLLPAKKAPESSLSYANCHYLYFGQPASNSPKSPLLMEFPFLHKEYFSIFYTDGTVEEIRLTGHRNVRRAVSFLHTVNSYEEEEFMRLMQIAAEFDKILE